MLTDTNLPDRAEKYKSFPGFKMKYTNYLINGDFFVSPYNSKSKIAETIMTMLSIIASFYLLGFFFALLPFSIATDFGRLFLSIEIRLMRKLKQISLVQSFRRNTLGLVYRGSRLAYLLIQKTGPNAHLKI